VDQYLTCRQVGASRQIPPLFTDDDFRHPLNTIARDDMAVDALTADDIAVVPDGRVGATATGRT